jgi:hypothetical protein
MTEATLRQIEITPEMIEAGCATLWDSDYGYDGTVSSEGVIGSILASALRTAGFFVQMHADQ